MSSQRGRRTESGADNEFQRAAKRLEQAVQELIGAAREQFSDSAVAFVEETTERLRERGERSERRARRRARRARRRGYGYGDDYGHRVSDGHLYRSRRDAWIGGVCGGLAEYFEMESWVVRLIAVSLLLFSPLTAIVGMAYCTAWCILPQRARGESLAEELTSDESASEGTRPRRRDKRRQAPLDHRPSVAPELGPRFSPRRSLREIRARFDAIELKLRRIESFVTSPRFELERELARMDGGTH